MGDAPTTLYEPFLGAGAVALAALERPYTTVVGGDMSWPLMVTWSGVLVDPERTATVLERLCAEPCTEARYYALRASFNAELAETRTSKADGWSDIAALAIYLNRAGFNGLWRFNRRGELNVPWGKREDVRVAFDAAAWAGVAARMSLWCAPYDVVLELAARDAQDGGRPVVYLDPPYAAPRGSDARPFVAYGTGLGWTMDDTFRVVDLATRVAEQGARVVLSHSADASPGGLNEKLRALGWTVHDVSVKRTISRDGATRAPVGEILAVLQPTP